MLQGVPVMAATLQEQPLPVFSTKVAFSSNFNFKKGEK